jgi:hypothetical protein
MTDNPFKYIYEVQPCRPDPFTMIGAPADMAQAGIEKFANARDLIVKAGVQPIPDFELKPGDCITAAQLLQDPILRLAFHLMLDCPELDGAQ